MWSIPIAPNVPDDVTDKSVARYIIETRGALDSCVTNLSAVHNLWKSAIAKKVEK